MKTKGPASVAKSKVSQPFVSLTNIKTAVKPTKPASLVEYRKRRVVWGEWRGPPRRRDLVRRTRAETRDRDSRVTDQGRADGTSASLAGM